MAAANALRVLSSSSACSSSSSSSSSSRKKKITTKHSSRGRRVIASSSSSSSSSSSPESNNHSPRRKKGCKPLRAILESCVLEPRSMDEDDENCETEKITDAKKTKRTMTSNRDENRSAATIVKTDFLVRFILSRVFTSFRRGLRRRRKEEEQAEDDKTLVLLYLSLRSKRVPVV